MPLTRSSLLRLVRIGIFVLIALLIIGYAIWRSFSYARGPLITIFDPADGAATTSIAMHITGRADRVNNLLLNGQAIFIDEQGNFREVVSLFPGLNIITLQGHDQFERNVEKQLRVVKI